METRTCTRCGETKPCTEFYVNAQMRGGHQKMCKPCTCAYQKERRVRLLADPVWAAKEAARQRAKSARFRAEGRASPVKPETQKAWRQRNPEKVRCHNAVARAIRSGKLVRGACEVCGEEKTHAHHDDYTKPLEVRWLCPQHHGTTHIKE